MPKLHALVLSALVVQALVIGSGVARAEDIQGVLILVGEDGEGVLAVARREFAIEVDDLVIEFGRHGRLGEAFADALGDLARA